MAEVSTPLDELAAIKAEYASLSRQRKIELWVIVGIAICGIISTIFVIQSTRKTLYDTSGVQQLQDQNKQLLQDNAKLVQSFNDMAVIIRDRTTRDSLSYVVAVQTYNRIPQIDSKLNQINQKYENINPSVQLSNDALSQYVANEAARIRNNISQGQ